MEADGDAQKGEETSCDLAKQEMVCCARAESVLQISQE
jgi:hypothetical protein